MLKLVSSNKCFGGYQKVFAHQSQVLGCEMKFGIYLPPTHDDHSKHPVLYFLSGLTCTEANFIQKSAFQKYAAEYGLIVVNPDTSPRGVGIAGEDDSYDFGSGAGFYLDATETKWSKHYRMYSYVVDELPALIATNFPSANTASQGITGHSMGGHGALTIALKNAHKYKCVSAIAPICNPTMCPWGIKAFGGYLGVDNKDAWKRYDACELAKEYVDDRQFDILIDQGEEDEFLKTEQLLPDRFVAACSNRLNVQLRMQPGYDHSYFFISTFIADHIAHHSKYLH